MQIEATGDPYKTTTGDVKKLDDTFVLTPTTMTNQAAEPSPSAFKLAPQRGRLSDEVEVVDRSSYKACGLAHTNPTNGSKRIDPSLPPLLENELSSEKEVNGDSEARQQKLEHLRLCLLRYEIERTEAVEAIHRIENRIKELNLRTSELFEKPLDQHNSSNNKPSNKSNIDEPSSNGPVSNQVYFEADNLYGDVNRVKLNGTERSPIQDKASTNTRSGTLPNPRLPVKRSRLVQDLKAQMRRLKSADSTVEALALRWNQLFDATLDDKHTNAQMHQHLLDLKQRQRLYRVAAPLPSSYSPPPSDYYFVPIPVKADQSSIDPSRSIDSKVKQRTSSKSHLLTRQLSHNHEAEEDTCNDRMTTSLLIDYQSTMTQASTRQIPDLVSSHGISYIPLESTETAVNNNNQQFINHPRTPPKLTIPPPPPPPSRHQPDNLAFYLTRSSTGGQRGDPSPLIIKRPTIPPPSSKSLSQSQPTPDRPDRKLDGINNDEDDTEVSEVMTIQPRLKYFCKESNHRPLPPAYHAMPHSAEATLSTSSRWDDESSHQLNDHLSPLAGTTTFPRHFNNNNLRRHSSVSSSSNRTMNAIYPRGRRQMALTKMTLTSTEQSTYHSSQQLLESSSELSPQDGKDRYELLTVSMRLYLAQLGHRIDRLAVYSTTDDASQQHFDRDNEDHNHPNHCFADLMASARRKIWSSSVSSKGRRRDQQRIRERLSDKSTSFQLNFLKHTCEGRAWIRGSNTAIASIGELQDATIVDDGIDQSDWTLVWLVCDLKDRSFGWRQSRFDKTLAIRLPFAFIYRIHMEKIKEQASSTNSSARETPPQTPPHHYQTIGGGGGDGSDSRLRQADQVSVNNRTTGLGLFRLRRKNKSLQTATTTTTTSTESSSPVADWCANRPRRTSSSSVAGSPTTTRQLIKLEMVDARLHWVKVPTDELTSLWADLLRAASKLFY